MAIYFNSGRYAVSCVRRGVSMTYTCKTLEEAQAKQREMIGDVLVELGLRRLYFHPDKILVLNYPRIKAN
jgi:UV DNA damage repair endonuclease